MKRLGIYVQVPFCQTKCTYCNFHTGVVSRKRFAPYAEAVCEATLRWERLGLVYPPRRERLAGHARRGAGRLLAHGRPGVEAQPGSLLSDRQR